MTLAAVGPLTLLARRGVLAILCVLLVIGTAWAPPLVNDLAWLLLLIVATFGIWRAVTQRRGDRLWWVGVWINVAAAAALIGLGVWGISGPHD